MPGEVPAISFGVGARKGHLDGQTGRVLYWKGLLTIRADLPFENVHVPERRAASTIQVNTEQFLPHVEGLYGECDRIGNGLTIFIEYPNGDLQRKIEGLLPGTDEL